MKRFVSAAATLLATCVAATAAAEPIQITAGSLTYGGGLHNFSPLALEGTQGFAFSARPGFGLFAPQDCLVPDCRSGAPISLLGRWVGMDLTGTATLGGVTYRSVGSASSNNAMAVEFDGSILAPMAGTTAVASAPFTFSGRFFVGDLPGVPPFDLIGAGTATASFTRLAGTDAWRIDRLDYQFSDPLATPEPATLLLVAGGGALVRWRCRRRRPSAR